VGIPTGVTCQATQRGTAPAAAAASTGLHRYRAWGLEIASAVELPQLTRAELRPADRPADLTVVLGSVEGPHRTEPGFRRWTMRDQFRYQIEAGRRIVIEPLPAALDEDVSDLLMSRVLTAAVYQRGLLPLHASAVATGGGIVAVCGRSGAGKSTLAGVLAARGGEVIGDDMIVISEDGAVMGAGAAGLKLSVASLARLGLTSHGLALANSVERKFFLPIAATVPRSQGIATLVQIGRGDRAVAPLAPAAAAAGWKACIRMPDLMHEAPDRDLIWRRWLDVVMGAANLSVAHGGRMEALEDIARQLERPPRVHAN
jgi:hypothetical protein